jgi:hypothetical protein
MLYQIIQTKNGKDTVKMIDSLQKCNNRLKELRASLKGNDDRLYERERGNRATAGNEASRGMRIRGCGLWNSKGSKMNNRDRSRRWRHGAKLVISSGKYRRVIRRMWRRIDCGLINRQWLLIRRWSET